MVLIGLVTIQTGSLLLIDPVHADKFDDDRADTDYEIVLDAAKRTAVVTRTGMGDGEYLVEGRHHEGTGMLAEIRVKFLDDEGNQVCYRPSSQGPRQPKS